MSVEGKTGPPDVSKMHTLKVDNLAYQTSIDDLKADFGRFGEVGDVYIPRHFGSGDPKGYAFVRFHSFQEAEDAIVGMNGQEIHGRELRVQMAQNKRPEDPKSHYARGRSDYRDRGGGYEQRRSDRGGSGGYERGYYRGNGYERGSYERSSGYDDQGRDRSRDRYQSSRSGDGAYSNHHRRSRSGGRDSRGYDPRDVRYAPREDDRYDYQPRTDRY